MGCEQGTNTEIKPTKSHIFPFLVMNFDPRTNKMDFLNAVNLRE